MLTTETVRTTDTSFVWLVNESPVADERSKDLIRANAAAWGHQTRRRRKRSSLRGEGIVTSSIQFRVLVFAVHFGWRY
jgi:plasmid stabilization system protein ParE